MADVEEEVTGVVYAQDVPLTYWVAVLVSAHSPSWWNMALTWRLCCIGTCNAFGVRLESFLEQVGKVRDCLRRGEEIWVDEIVP